MNIRIATRGSRLALCQSEIVKKKIMSLDPSARCELVIVRTAGDRNQHAPLHTLGGKGVFVREIEECLLNGEADLAVHSMKDMPAELPQGLCYADAWEGEDPRDALVLRQGIDEQTLHAPLCHRHRKPAPRGTAEAAVSQSDLCRYPRQCGDQIGPDGGAAAGWARAGGSRVDPARPALPHRPLLR
mgnify:CR=1 FL=1